MNADTHSTGTAKCGDYVVRRPRSADALGHALRSVFSDTPLPDDLLVLLQRIERVVH